MRIYLSVTAAEVISQPLPSKGDVIQVAGPKYECIAFV